MSRTPGEAGALTHRSADSVQTPVDANPGASTSAASLSFDISGTSPWADWERIPVEVITAIDHAQLRPSVAFASGTEVPRVRRRGSSFLERAAAWTVGASALILIYAARPLEQLANSRFRPAGDWTLDVRQRPIVGTPRRRVGSVAADGQPATLATATLAAPSDDEPEVIDVLPAVVRKQILTTVPQPDVAHDYLIQQVTEAGQPCAHEGGLLRADASTMIALNAHREITPSRWQSAGNAATALDRAPWQVETLTVQLGAEDISTIVASKSHVTPSRHSPTAFSHPPRPELT